MVLPLLARGPRDPRPRPRPDGVGAVDSDAEPELGLVSDDGGGPGDTVPGGAEPPP